MNIQVIGDNIEIDNRYKEIVEDKLSDNLDRLLQDFEEDMKHATVKVGKNVNKDFFKLNFDMWLPGKKHIFADAESDDYVNAVVELREKIESQIESYKTKLQDRKSK